MAGRVTVVSFVLLTLVKQEKDDADRTKAHGDCRDDECIVTTEAIVPCHSPGPVARPQATEQPEQWPKNEWVHVTSSKFVDPLQLCHEVSVRSIITIAFAWSAKVAYNTVDMKDAVEQIKERLSIIDVISPYVELHKAGKNFKGKSPFTNEKTPSFYVSPDRGMYYCFSTSQGGDMFTFIETMEGVDFKGALKILADKARVELVPISPEKQSERDRLYAVLEAATLYYQQELQKNATALAYLKERGLLLETIASWRIGYAPGPGGGGGWRAVKEHLIQKGFTATELFKAGLIKQAADGKEPYDVFRHRIMFPLFDQGGRPVAFSGRTLDTDKEVPKYVNSPETELYKKSELLYGYDRAKHGIRHLDFSLIVEGQFDVVLSHQAGYTNTVAVSGTAFTLQHVQLLERLSTRVVLALDSDKAGIAAAKRAADIMLRRGLDVKVAMLPKKDPADMVKDDPKEFKRVIGNSVHIIEFLMSMLADQHLDPRTFKLRAREEVIPYIPLLPNRIDQDHFEQIVADLLKTTKDAVHYEVERCVELQAGKSHVAQKPESGSIKQNLDVESLEMSGRKNALIARFISHFMHLNDDESSRHIRVFLTEILGEDFGEISKGVSASNQARLYFTQEKNTENRPLKQFKEEVVNDLNELHDLVIREKLRRKQAEIKEHEEAGGNVTVITALLRDIDTLRQNRKTNRFTFEDIFKE